MRYFYNLLFAFILKTIFITLLIFISGEAVMALTVADVTINTSATSGGTWSSTAPWIFTPNAGVTSANILNTELQTKLGIAEVGYNVTINTTNASGSSLGNGDIIFSAAVTLPPIDSRTTTFTLTLNATRNITINSALTLAGISSFCCGIGMGDNLILSAPSGSITISAAISTIGGANTGGGGSSGYNGGNITMIAGTTVNISAGIVTTGGTAAKGIGGNAGDISITAPNGLTLAANITANGGAGTTGPQGGAGGDGGDVTINDGAILVTSGGGAGANDGQVSGIIAAIGASGTTVGAGGSFIKSGNGTFQLSQLNTYTGTTTVNAGFLRASSNIITASSNGPFGNNASGLILNGGTIQSNVATFNRPITVTNNGSGLDAYGSARTISSTINNATASSTYNLNVGGTTITNVEGQDLTLSGVISNTAGSLSVTKIGTSKATLSAANTFSGGTRLNAGQININHATAIGSGPFTISGGIIDNTTASSITLSNNNTQNWNGDFTFTGTQPLNMGTGAITLNANRQITVSGGTLTAGGIINQSSLSLVKAGSGIFSFGNQAITLNNLAINAGTFISSSGNLTLSGNFSNSGTFTHNNGTVIFNGASAQTLGGATFNNLTINNSAGVTLSTNITFNALLTLTSGIIATGAFALIAPSSATVSRTSGHVYGNFKKNIALGGTSATFEVGDANKYAPVLVAFASVTTAGDLTASTTAGDHPYIGSSTIYSPKSVNRYWTLTNSGIVFTTYNATFTFVAGDLDVGVTTSNFIVGRFNAGWTYPTVGTKTSTSTQAKTLIAFGDFQLGEIYAIKTFTGTGNFSDAARWTGGTLPVAGENLVIDGSCTVDNNPSTDNIAYGNLNIGSSTGRTLNWAAGGTNRLNVLSISAGAGASALSMTNGGTLITRGTWSSANLAFTPGAGTIEMQSAITLPAAYATFNNLTINGSGNTVNLGAVTSITGNLIITSGTLNANNFNLNVTGNWTNNAPATAFTGGTATVTFNGTLSQAIGGTFATTFNDLTIANTGTVTLNTNVSIGGNLSVTNGTFDLASFTANRSSIGGTLTVSDNAVLKIGGTNTYPANYSTNTLGPLSTVEYSGTTQAVKGITYSNLTLSGAGSNSKTAYSDITVNGILNLSSANASATQGCLEMSTYILTMGANATTIGPGDVTGIVKRTTFIASVPYTFGNRFTTITFNAGGTYPSQIQIKIKIGTAPSWNTAGIKRLYDFMQTGAINSYATTSYHYLDSELNGNNEFKLAFMIYGTPGPPPGLTIVGSSNHNSIDEWVSISNANLQYLATSFDDLQIGLIESDLPTFTWNGSTNSDWNEIGNWTPLGVPVSSSNIVIPDAATTPNDPTLPSSVEIKTMTIEAGGILNALSSEQLTINGENGAWSNIGGVFNAALSNVIFTNAQATLAGTTNFHDLTIGSGAALTPQEGNTLRISGALTNNGILRAVVLNNLIEYNGANQTVINPNGAVPGYSHLILSGSGTKTMPASALSIAGDLTLLGSASATAGAAIAIGGSVTIGSGTTLNLSTFSHSLAGNLTNNGGTFTASIGSLTFNGTTLQTITSASGITFNNLNLTNTNANLTLGTSTDCSIAGNLSINSGAVFNLSGNSLTAVTGTISNSGTIKSQSTSATLIPSGKTWGGTFEYTASAAQTIVAGTYNNLTMTGSGGASAVGNITINGILTLTQANPSTTKGILDMRTSTLLMGPSSTTIGQGDVTGIVRRTTIVANTTYTYGNQFTTINFPNVGTLPSELSLKISIGTAPTWKTNGINRVYDLIQTGGSGTQALLYAHYLDSELNGNDKNLLVDWVWISPSTKIEYGRSSYNTTDNWVAISNVNVGVFSSVFGAKQITLSPSETLALTWNGSVSTSWVTANNWTPNGAPSDLTAITIPDASTTNFNLSIPNIATCGSINLKSGAIINANSGAQLTINGGDGAWNNEGGTFNAGTSTLIFKNAGATISGATDFYNLSINNGATVALNNNAYMGISGTLTNDGVLITVDRGATTVEYKGGDQTVVVPNPSTDRYSSLILSGSGTKTMPSSALSIVGDFFLSGTTTSTAGSALTVAGNMNIGTGATFITGNNNHFIAGNFTNNGTFTSATGYYITMNGTSAAQSMGGSSTTTFDHLTIDNRNGVNLSATENVNSVLSLTNGNLNVGANTLRINGTINRALGNIAVTTNSSLNFGGTSDIIIPDNVFTTTPVINNLTINRTGRVTLGNQNMTINGLMDIQSGTFTLGSNSLILAGSSPVRSSGFIDAANAGSTITFTNSSAITLPVNLFIEAVNNLTINGSGVTSSGDFTLNGVLNLQSANPSAFKGSLDMWDGSISKTLTMGIAATTIGAGDVTGIVSRTAFAPNMPYTFGNQFTTIAFALGGTYPSEFKLKISIGTAPSWDTQAIKREYDFAQTGGVNCFATFLSHYLDSELNGNAEEDMVQWVNTTPGIPGGLYEAGRSNFNTTDNWVSIANVNIGYIPPFFGQLLSTLAVSELPFYEWNGSLSSSWTTIENWTPNGAPSSTSNVIIPDASTTPFSPSLPTSTEIKTLTIEPAGILNANANAQLTLNGDNGAWSNVGGTFYPATSKVIFTNPAATISGITNFYNLTIDSMAALTVTSGNIMRIAGTMINKGIWHAVIGDPTTVEYNGLDQTIVIPNPVTQRYSNLILSGSGTKTMPFLPLNILGDFIISNAAKVNVHAPLTVYGDLSIASGCLLSIAPAVNLNALKTINNNAGSSGLMLHSDATGTASLIHHTDNVPATVERYISGTPEAWHLISSPVSGQGISGSWLPSGSYGNATGYDLYLWNEPTFCWIYQLNTTSVVNWNTVHPGGDFTVGRGYLYSVQATNPTKVFVGNLNNGPLNYQLTAQGTDLSLQGFNLVGNPYPSSADWQAVSGWTRTNLVNSGGGYDMWIWNPSANNYGVFNSFTGIGTNDVTRFIAPMQGFFVQAASDGPLGMNNEVRIQDAASEFKNAKIDPLLLSLSVQSEADKGFDEVQLLFGYPASQPGARKLFSNVATAPGLFMSSKNENYSVQYLTDTIDHPTIPVMFKPGLDGKYSLLCNFDDSRFKTVILEDRQMHSYQDLISQNSYHFKASTTDDQNRFTLHFTPVNIPHGDKLPVRIYAQGAQLVVDLTAFDIDTELLVYDILGRKLLQQMLQGKTLHKVKINGQNQIVVVQLINQEGSYIQKLLYK